MASTPSLEAVYKEGRVILATQAYQRNEFKSVKAAAKSFDIPRTTLRSRVNGTAPKRGSIAKNRLLTLTEEETIVQWILSMDRRGMPPRVAAIAEMGAILLKERGESGHVGKNWYQKFINRHEAIKTKYNRKYDYQRAQCEDPEVIRAWFHRVQSTIVEYGILPEDIYNFDETGFQMGVIATAKVVTGTERRGRPRTTQPGNREWVTCIETINARGFSIPPLIILEAVMHQAAWYSNIPEDWSIGVSENGWTTNEIGLHWLEHVFDKHTVAHTIGRYRLLILDGHGSHINPEFDRYCQQHSIIVLCMPAHSSHLLQPLDVSCFAVLKRSYGRLVEQKMSLGVNHIDKQEFLLLYQQARLDAIYKDNIKSGFAATGLVPYNPERVLSILHAPVNTPSPQLHAQTTIYTAATPHNIAELEQQAGLIQRNLKRRRRTQSPPSPTDQAFNQLIKGCQLAMHNAAILKAQNKQLIEENKRQKLKRAKKRSYIAKGGVLSGAQAQMLIDRADNGTAEAEPNRVEEARSRAPPRCSVCYSFEHKANKCPER
jgi:hypothetical protein